MNTGNRGDLAVIRTVSHLAQRRLGRDSSVRYDLAVIASTTRDRRVKAVRQITGADASAGSGKATSVDRLSGHEMVILPNGQLRVADALTAIHDRRSDPRTGKLPSYTTPVELLRDLHPWRVGDGDCLSDIRRAAYLHVRDCDDQRCGICGVTTYGNGHVVTADDSCPVAQCAEGCPIGVNFTTDYPIGLEVMVSGGFAVGAVSHIERVSDAYPPELSGPRHYAGRSYTLCLPSWGCRTFGENYIRPLDSSLVERYAVRREASGD